MNQNQNTSASNGVNIIEVNNLTKKFGDFTAVHNISFQVKKGEIFGFLGPNGAGKSTTIKMLTTLMHPTSGMISVDGHDPMKEADAVRHSFGAIDRWNLPLPHG